MAVITLYSIHDVKTGLYFPPFSAPNDPTAVRLFSRHVMEENSDFNVFSEDYSLWRVGDFNQADAEITFKPKELISHAHELKKALQEQN